MIDRLCLIDGRDVASSNTTIADAATKGICPHYGKQSKGGQTPLRGIDQERAARQVAEGQLEGRKFELQENTQVLNQHIEIVTGDNKKRRKNTLEIEQMRNSS